MHELFVDLPGDGPRQPSPASSRIGIFLEGGGALGARVRAQEPGTTTRTGNALLMIREA